METIKLDLIPGKKMPSLHASQFDDGREHGIDLFENGVAYKLDGTETLTINERKGDNCICSLDIENTFTGSNHIVFASTEQMCAVWGNNLCELVIAKGEVSIGTLNFILDIEPSPTEGGIESESEISNLKRQIEEITEQVIGDDYYTAEETDEAIATATEGKADTTYVDTELAKKADKTDTYTKTQVDNALNNKMDKANPTGTGSLSMNRKEGTTVGSASVTLGILNTASGAYSSAVGLRNTASGKWAHVIGNDNTASIDSSLALGAHTTASGVYSQSQGNYTLANHRSQFVFGEYNEADNSSNTPNLRGNYVEIVGNGTSDIVRSNARTLDWQGNETLAGDVIINGNQSVSGEITRLDGKIDNLPAPMIFKGTLGVGGTIQTLPTASASNEGFTYKVITDGTYAGQTAKVGDVFTSNGSAWVYIPSGDEDNDTWRAIKVNGVEKLGNGISSGAVDFVGSDNIEVEFDANGNKVGIKTKNIYTQAQVDSIVSDAIYNVLPDDTASGSVANFNTSLELPLKSLEIDVNAVQEAGTPTPSSPKAISGWNAITLDANGNTEVINLGGTYYGGHFTQDKAGHRQLVVTHELKHLKDLNVRYSNNSGAWASWLFFVGVDDKKQGKPIKCTHYETVTINNVGNLDNLKATAPTWSNYFYWRDDTYTSADDFIQNAPDITILVELATPIIIDLPDGEPITTLIGTNNIYADSGDCAVEYKVSVEDYVSRHSGGGLLGGNPNPDESEGE